MASHVLTDAMPQLLYINLAQQIDSRVHWAALFQHTALPEMLQPFRGIAPPESEQAFNVAPRDVSVGFEKLLYLRQNVFLRKVVGLSRDVGTFEACVVFDFPQHRRVGSKVEVAHADVVAAHFVNRFSLRQIQVHRKRKTADGREMKTFSLREFANHGGPQNRERCFHVAFRQRARLLNVALELVSVHGSSLMKVCIMAFFAFAVRIFDGMDFILNAHGKIGFEKNTLWF